MQAFWAFHMHFDSQATAYLFDSSEPLKIRFFKAFVSYLRITHNHTNQFRIYQYILILLFSKGSSSTSSLNSMDDFMTSSNSFLAHSGAFSFNFQPSCGLLKSNQPSFTNLGSAIIRITFLCLDYIIRVEIFKCRSKSPSVVILCGQGRSLNKEPSNLFLQDLV